jgi:hypothetical protein
MDPMIALSLDILIGLVLAVVIVAPLIAEAARLVGRKRRQRKDRDTERRKHWGYV